MDEPVPVYLTVYPYFIFWSHPATGLNRVTCDHEISMSPMRRFRSHEELDANVHKGNIVFLKPYFLDPETLKTPGASGWFPIPPKIQVCRRCYAFLAIRGCCEDESHKTLCGQCQADKCDLCSYLVPYSHELV